MPETRRAKAARAAVSNPDDAAHLAIRVTRSMIAAPVRAAGAMIAAIVAMMILSFSTVAAAAQPDRPAPSNAAPSIATATDTTVVLLVRHAERASEAANSDLSATGLARAEHIAALAEEAGVQAVYSTDLCRTAQTAQPAATALGLPIRVVATGSANAGLDACSPGIDVQHDVVPEPTPAGVAQRVLREQRGHAALVIGHSNTVPAIAEALGASVCPTLLQPDEQGRCWLADDRYDDLFIVRVPADGGTVTVMLHSATMPL